MEEAPTVKDYSLVVGAFLYFLSGSVFGCAHAFTGH